MNFTFDVEKLNLLACTDINEYIALCESEKENNLRCIAERIVKNKKRVVFVTGPSASNKTSVANRLIYEFKRLKKDSLLISLDDYFWGTTGGRKLEQGVYNFEDIDAIDYELVAKHIKELVLGNEILMPIFDFYKVCRKSERIKIKLCEDSILVVEGIHAFNPVISDNIDKKLAFKLYSSVEYGLNFKGNELISSDNVRLMRRMVRDSKYRNAEADITFAMWPSVQDGVIRNIIPFKKDADAIFDSFLSYECLIYKKEVLNLLKKCEQKNLYLDEIEDLRKILSPLTQCEDVIIPENSMLREFIG